jgi:KDO2-lipid IV(A) lauroyltransferase
MAKPGSRLQTSLEYGATRFIIAVLGVLPPALAMAIGQQIGNLAFVLAGNLRRTGVRNLELAFPEKDQRARTELLRGCFRNLGRGLGVFSQMSTRSAETLRKLIRPQGLEHIELAKSEGKGVILYTGHLGAWELTSFGLSILGYPVSFLVRKVDNPQVEDFIDQTRMRFGNQTMDKMSAARSMVKILRSGEVLGLLLDLNTLDDEAIFVDFFGIPASTNFVVAKLALRSGSPIIPIFAPWDPESKKFLMRIQPPVLAEATGDEEADIRRLTEKLTLVIENEIRHYPDQWLWIHRRWKTRPPGEPPIY